MKTKNLPEFKALQKRYETITIEEIEEIFIKHKRIIIQNRFTENDLANELTGFGNFPHSCTLCQPVDKCEECVYGFDEGCLSGENEKTYKEIGDADTPIKLLNAFRARAKHMKTLLK